MSGIRIVLSCAAGERIERELTYEQILADEEAIGSIRARLAEPPDCLVRLRKSWPNPQDPILYEADVLPGREQEAREWLLA